eukprot:TRINITY_DN10650_c0_g1_i1.p1 TRINITY_DN10650_c0_g1~~TRINITY_DN10650_c0_g1_i1.p1  ORF type:complete len:440 (+),score=100.72 TRINITY_DN10650_c0_g1_i1:40-1359(+)
MFRAFRANQRSSKRKQRTHCRSSRKATSKLAQVSITGSILAGSLFSLGFEDSDPLKNVLGFSFGSYKKTPEVILGDKDADFYFNLFSKDMETMELLDFVDLLTAAGYDINSHKARVLLEYVGENGEITKEQFSKWYDDPKDTNDDLKQLKHRLKQKYVQDAIHNLYIKCSTLPHRINKNSFSLEADILAGNVGENGFNVNDYILFSLNNGHQFKTSLTLSGTLSKDHKYTEEMIKNTMENSSVFKASAGTLSGVVASVKDAGEYDTIDVDVLINARAIPDMGTITSITNQFQNFNSFIKSDESFQMFGLSTQLSKDLIYLALNFSGLANTYDISELQRSITSFRALKIRLEGDLARVENDDELTRETIKASFASALTPVTDESIEITNALRIVKKYFRSVDKLSVNIGNTSLDIVFSGSKNLTNYLPTDDEWKKIISGK